VPTFNRAALLASSIGSIFDQTVPVHEVIVIDDGSTDDTEAAVRAICIARGGGKPRLRYVRQPNEGKSAAINVGLRLAEGEWIAFNDSDDRWLPQKLELQLDALAMYPKAAACFTDVRFVNNPRLPKTLFEMSNLTANGTFGMENDVTALFTAKVSPAIYMQTMVVSTDAMRAFGEFDASVRMSMDTDFVFRLALATPMCFVNRPLVDVDRTEPRLIGLTTQYPLEGIERLKVHEELQTKWLSLAGDADAGLKRRLLDRRSFTQSALANQYLLQGDLETARDVLWRALRQNKTSRILAKFALMRLAPGLLRREIARRAAARG
jgi:glycosyltransferase involved in cell wall biosynthesis